MKPNIVESGAELQPAPIPFASSLLSRIFFPAAGIAALPAFAAVIYTRNIPLFLGSIMVSTLLAYAFARSLAKPVQMLLDAVRRIASGDTTARAAVQRKDEIGRLAYFFNATVEKFLETQQRGRVLSEIKSQFVMVAAHQLRTPLSAMKWTLRLMLDGDMGALTEKQQEFLQQGYETNDRMIRLVNDFLDVSRIEEGRFGFQFKKIRIISVLERAVADSHLAARPAEVSISFERDIPEDTIVIADEDRLYTVMMDMLDNAVRYSSNESAVAVSAARKDHYIKVSISDAGIGIPADEQQKIFSRFYRASNAIRRQTEGSGLGLYIARNIIRRHGGSVGFLSEEGKGTTMYFTLPIYKN